MGSSKPGIEPAQLLAAGIVALAWMLALAPRIDPDLWLHLWVGGGALAGAIPTHDGLSWLVAGGRWYPHSWLFDVALTLAYNAAGLQGIAVVGAILAAILIAACWSLLAEIDPGSGPIARALTIALVMALGYPAWSARAQILDLVFLLVVFREWFAWKHRSARSLAFTLPALALLWANLHGP